MAQLFKSVLIILLFTASAFADSGQPLNIYVPGSHTGMMPFLAAAINDASIAFAKDVNSKGGLFGRKVNVIAQDDKNDILLAEKNASVATADPNHLISIGHPFSSMAIPIGKYYEKRYKLIASPYATNQAVGKIGRFVKQLCFNDALQAKILAQTVTNELKAKKILVLYNESDPYSSGLATDFTSELSNSKTVLLKKLGYIFDHIDYKNIVTTIDSFEPDVIFLPELKVRAVEILNQILSANQKAIPVLGADGWGSETGTMDIFFSGMKNEIDAKFLYTYHYHPDINTPENRALKKEFARHKIELYGPAVITYEFLKQLEALIKKTGSVSNAVLADALSTYQYKGSTGPVKFTPNGTIKGMALLELNRRGLKLKKVVEPK